MKKLAEVIEVDNEGLISLLGKKIIVFTPTYIYCGNLTGVNDKFIKLEDGGIVYETGEWSNSKFTDFQKIQGKPIYLFTHAIISFMETSKV